MTDADRARIARLSGQVGGLRRASAPGYDGQAATAAARAARQAALEAQVDPQGTMDPASRAAAVRRLRQAQLAAGRLTKAQQAARSSSRKPRRNLRGSACPA